MRDDQVRVDCQVLFETERSLKVRLEDDRIVFVPLSEITEIHRRDGWIVVSRWIAEKEDLI